MSSAGIAAAQVRVRTGGPRRRGAVTTTTAPTVIAVPAIHCGPCRRSRRRRVRWRGVTPRFRYAVWRRCRRTRPAEAGTLTFARDTYFLATRSAASAYGPSGRVSPTFTRSIATLVVKCRTFGLSKNIRRVNASKPAMSGHVTTSTKSALPVT
jgi:predicted Fe-S protein YdhL (DUF1289 family)